jgi:hypothetical protein
MNNKKLSIDVTDQWERSLRWKDRHIKDPDICTGSRMLGFIDKWAEVLDFGKYMPLYKYVEVRGELYQFHERGLGAKICHNETTITDDEIINCPTYSGHTLVFLLIGKGFSYKGICSPELLGTITKVYDREGRYTTFTQVVKASKQERWH